MTQINYLVWKQLDTTNICHFCKDINDDDSFLTLDQFSNKFGFCVIFLQYNEVISSLPQMLKSYQYGDKSSNLQTPFVPSSLQNIFRSSKGSKDMHTILNKNSSVPTAQ